MAGDDYAGQTGQPTDDDETRRRRMEEFIVRSAIKPTIPKPEPALKQPNTQYSGTTGGTPTNHPSKGPQDPYGQTGYTDNEAPVRPQAPKIEGNRLPGQRNRGPSGSNLGYYSGSVSDDNDELVRRAGGMNESGATTTPRMPVLGASRPNIPTPRTSDTPSPDINANAPSTPPPPNGRRLLGVGPTPVLGLNRGVQPARPDVQPMRSDFPERKLPGWEKALGIVAAPFVPALSANIFTGPRREAERQYESAAKDWTLGQESAERQARTEEAQARTAALRNPPPKEGTTPEDVTLHDLMTGGPNGGPKINPQTQRPYEYLEAYSAVQQAKTGAAQGAKQPPFDAATLGQLNDMHTQRFQQLNPGKPLPAALTLRPGSTQADYERVDKNLGAMESAQGTQAQREATNTARTQAELDRQEARRAAAKAILAEEDPKLRKTGAERLIEQAYRRALQGSYRHLELLLAYAEGRPRQAIEALGKDGNPLETLVRVIHIGAKDESEKVSA